MLKNAHRPYRGHRFASALTLVSVSSRRPVKPFVALAACTFAFCQSASGAEPPAGTAAPAAAPAATPAKAPAKPPAAPATTSANPATSAQATTSTTDEAAAAEGSEAAPPEGAAPEATSDAAPEAAAAPVEPTKEQANEEPQTDVEADEQKSWMELNDDDDDDDDDDDAKKKMPFYTTFLLVEGTAKYGALTVAQAGTTLDDDSFEPEVLRAGHLGGQVTLGIMPGGSAFTMGGRLRGGSYVGERATLGNIAAEMVFGANFARNAQGSSFTYVLGGMGVELIPAENQDMLTLHLSGGTVINGVDFGAGINIGANDEYAFALFGMHMGWGRLF